MTPIMLGWTGIAVLIAIIMLRVPVAVSLGLVGYFGYALVDGFPRANLIVGQTPIELAQAYAFSVVPLFTLMGAVVAVSGLSSDLFKAANTLMRGMRGSLALASIFSSAMFGAVCGSSVATALAMSKVSIPHMLAAGYKPNLAAGVVAAGGTLGILIPPSLILMIYAIIAQQSVATLFMASLIPGIILMLLYACVAMVMVRRGDAPVVEAVERQSMFGAVGRIWHVVFLFAVTIGGIYAGWFTPTEAAAIGAFGAVALGLLLRRMSFRMLGTSFMDSVRLVSSIIFIVLGSKIFSYFIVQTGIAGSVSGGLQTAGFSAPMVILLMCAIYIVMGCFLDGIAMILITVPITLPLILAYGYDPVWFGVLLVILIEIGLITPPVGMNLFVIRAVNPEISISAMYRGAIPFLAAPFVLIIVMILWPNLTMWLPNLLNK